MHLTCPGITRFLYAIDLFNLQYYWEVHEVLEQLWIHTGKTAPVSVFVQGLIQLSIALLKKIQSNTKGTEILAKKALLKLRTQKGVYLGVDIDLLIAQFNEFVSSKQFQYPQIHFRKFEDLPIHRI